MVGNPISEPPKKERNPVLTIAAGLRSIRRLRGRDHDVAATHTLHRPTIRSWSGAALTAALTIAFIVLAAAAVYFDLVTR
jgi:hypothetical protein